MRWLVFVLMPACFGGYKSSAQVESLPQPGAFPHQIWSEVLEARVDAQGKVDFKGLREDRARIDLYTAYVQAASPDSHPELFPTREDQLAYYLNAYNALAITGVIERPGLQSVEDSLGEFFYLQKYTLGGQKMSLHALETDVVRARFGDPRVHFALNCASAGCPRLPRAAFEPATIDAQLDDASAEFCADRAKVFLRDDVVHASQIFEWYAEDFESSGGPAGFCSLHGVGLPQQAAVEFIPYDWTLTAQPGRAP